MTEDRLPKFFTNEEREWYESVPKNVMFAIARDLASISIGIGVSETHPHKVLPVLLDVQAIVESAGYVGDMKRFNRILCNGFSMPASVYYQVLNVAVHTYDLVEEQVDTFFFSNRRYQDGYNEEWQESLDSNDAAYFINALRIFYSLKEV